jgi:hypothetical protein
MGNTSLIRTALLVALLTAFGLAAAGRAPAAEEPVHTARSGQLPSAFTAPWLGCLQPFCCASTCRR